MISSTDKLINTYQNAQQNMIRIIATKEAKGSTTQYQRELLAQINKELEQLLKESNKFTIKVIPQEYKNGVNYAQQGLIKLGIADAEGYSTFARLHTKQIELLVNNTNQDFIDANMFVGRQLNDTIRQAGIEATTQKVSEGQTVKEMQKILQNKLIDQGINGIRTKNDSYIRLDAYAELVARSTPREAQNKGMLNQLTNLGYDLVKMSSHATSCPICASLQGRVYSISGQDTRYPKLSVAYAGEHANIHPRCRHVLMPYIPALADNPDNDKEFSNRSFNVDDENKRKFDTYNQQQKEKAKLRADRIQWENYKLVLPNETPKTLSGFRRMKNANSEKYQQLQKSYKNVRIKEV